MRLLVVEDESRLAVALSRGLVAEGFVVDIAVDGKCGLESVRLGHYDAAILDVMLPRLSGYEVVRSLRAEQNWLPVLMLSAKDGEYDQADGLDCGADDYLTKPFSFVELMARLRALARRGPIEKAAVLAAGDLSLDPAARRVWRGPAEITLSAKEFALLETFMRRPGAILSRFELLEHAWDHDYENRSNVIDVYVRYLRDKVDRPFGVKCIETVRGAGYRLRADGGVAAEHGRAGLRGRMATGR